MSVSLYYRASRAIPLTAAETAAVERIATAHLSAFPYEDEEALYLYDGGGSGADDVLAGSTKMPLDDDRIMPVLDHLLAAVTELRRALPDAHWHVHLDDTDLLWHEEAGYAFPGE
jgi:hypothetical protein